MTLSELTKAIAGARERDLELWGLGMALSPSETLEAQNDRRALLAVIDQLLPDARRLDFLIEWLGFNEDVSELPVRDWNDSEDARLAIDEAIDRAIEGEKK